MLHLTNGDCAIEPLRAAGVEGEILPWRENLLEGPVRREPSGAEHDDRLQRALAAQEPVMLWFEADLFDVRLLIQILERVPSGAPVLLVLVGQERWEPSEERWVGGTRIPPGAPPWLWDAGTVRAAR